MLYRVFATTTSQNVKHKLSGTCGID